MDKQVVFEKDGIKIYDDGSHFEGWIVESQKNEYLAVVDEGYYHLCLKEDYPNEPPIAEKICKIEDDSAYERIVEAVRDYEVDNYILTPTEQRIAEIINTQGLTNAEIAKMLGVKKGTIDAHLRNIYMKLKLRNRAELIIHMREKKEG